MSSNAISHLLIILLIHLVLLFILGLVLLLRTQQLVLIGDLVRHILNSGKHEHLFGEGKILGQTWAIYLAKVVTAPL